MKKMIPLLTLLMVTLFNAECTASSADTTAVDTTAVDTVVDLTVMHLYKEDVVKKNQYLRIPTR